MTVLELTEREVQTLRGILLVEQSELQELISNEESKKDKNELESELKRVISILNKLK